MLKQANLNKLIIAALVSVMILSGCAAPTATAIPATAAPAATAVPATAAPATTSASTAASSALPVEMWTYYGDTGPAAACVKTAAADFNAAQSQYVLNIRNLAFTDFNHQI
jgi:PBP1b-binding outer membrane lipoprotein LpoB